jgi:hypothetical protein
MFQLSRLCLALMLSLGSLSNATAGDDPAAWVEQLASDTLRVRQEAEAKLWKTGTQSFPALEAALAHKQPEVAFRAAKILHYLQLGLSPDSPKELVDLAQSFDNLSIEGKQEALTTLKQQRHFRIALLLFQRVKEPHAQAMLRSYVSGLSIVAAREAMIAGDSARALRFLTDFPEDPKNTYALAWIARTEGRLDAEIAKTRASKDPESWRYLLALHRIKGDRANTLALAEKHKLSELAASIDLLNGRPENWLRATADRTDQDIRDIVRAYAAIVTDRINNRKENPSQLNLIIKAAHRESDYTRRAAAINALYALGNEAQANKAVAGYDSAMLFSFVAEREKIDDALKVLKLDPSKPDYGAVIDRCMALIIENEDSDEMSIVSTLVHFLEKRGIHEPIEKHFVPQMLKLAAADNERFSEMLGICFSGYGQMTRNSAESAAKIAAAYAKDDDILWGSIISTAFSDNSQYTQWWDWLGELLPRDARAERFRKMLVLFRVVPDRKNEVAALENLIEKALADDNEKEAENHLKLISILAAYTRLTKYTLWSLTDKSDLDTSDLMNLERWEEAATEWEEAIKRSPQAIHSIIWAAACFHKAGQTAKAAQHEKSFDALVLADSSLMYAAASIYKYVGLNEKSLTWENMALMCGSRDATWYGTLHTRAEEQLLNGQWQLALASLEAYNLFLVTQNDTEYVPILFRARKKADMAYAFSLYKKQPETAMALLRGCHQSLLIDASLADEFFPALRLVGAKAEHDAWFEESWQAFMKVRDRFPEDDNVRNSAAWLASRCLLRLDDAEREVKEALRLRPEQGAFLDTLAEIHFARGDRKKAVEWSKKALESEPTTTSLRGRYYRFVQDPFPK